MTEPEVQSLWCQIQQPEKVVTPYFILRQQAKLFCELTGHTLQASVMSTEPGNSYGLFIKQLEIVGGFVRRRRLLVLEIQYGLSFYPVKLIDNIQGTMSDCTDQDSFINALEKILKSEALQASITVLLSHVYDHEKW